MVKRLYFSFCVALLLLISSPANARGWVLDTRGLAPSEIQFASRFVEEVWALLPVKVTSTFDRKFSVRPIRIRFSKMGEELELPRIPCQERQEDAQASGETVPKLGRVDSNLTIHLNRLFLKEIEKGPRDCISFPCRHSHCHFGNYYRLATATLIHEFGHIFETLFSITQSGPKYRKIAGWRDEWSLSSEIFPRGLHPKNTSVRRSPDPYEYENLSEHFAVNFEHFVLDQDYRCRRPLLYHYFSKDLKMGPRFESYECRVNTLLLNLDLSSGDEQRRHEASASADRAFTQFGVDLLATPSEIDLKPEQIYQIHYFPALRGGAIQQSFGHAQFRLVICNPKRKEVGPACLTEDSAFHRVVTFSAAQDSVSLGVFAKFVKIWKGVSGSFPSRVFIRPLADVIREYTLIEPRGLESLPLILSDEEKKMFVYRILENYWEYNGRYYFFTNNCNHEAVHLLKAILDRKVVSQISARRPMSLKAQLLELKLLDDSVLKDRSKAIRGQYLYPPQELNLQRAFNYLKLLRIQGKLVPLAFPWETLDRYLNRSAYFARRELAKAVSKIKEGNLSMSFTSLMILEKAILEFKVDDLQKKALINLETDPELAPFREEIAQEKEIQLTPSLLAVRGYGIPMLEDFDREVLAKSSERMRLTAQRFERWVKEAPEFKEDFAEIEEIQANYQEFLRTATSTPPK